MRRNNKDYSRNKWNRNFKNIKDKWNNGFFEKINNICKPLAKLTKRKREEVQVNKIKVEKGTDSYNRYNWYPEDH